jgi:hypothetical protein
VTDSSSMILNDQRQLPPAELLERADHQLRFNWPRTVLTHYGNRQALRPVLR